MTLQSANPAPDGRALPLPDPARVRAAKIRLIEQDTNAATWARENGENPALVHKVLSGRRACVKGASLRVALKLGILDADGAVAPVAANA